MHSELAPAEVDYCKTIRDCCDSEYLRAKLGLQHPDEHSIWEYDGLFVYDGAESCVRCRFDPAGV